LSDLSDLSDTVRPIWPVRPVWRRPTGRSVLDLWKRRGALPWPAMSPSSCRTGAMSGFAVTRWPRPFTMRRSCSAIVSSRSGRGRTIRWFRRRGAGCGISARPAAPRPRAARPRWSSRMSREPASPMNCSRTIGLFSSSTACGSGPRSRPRPSPCGNGSNTMPRPTSRRRRRGRSAWRAWRAWRRSSPRPRRNWPRTPCCAPWTRPPISCGGRSKPRAASSSTRAASPSASMPPGPKRATPPRMRPPARCAASRCAGAPPSRALTPARHSGAARGIPSVRGSGRRRTHQTRRVGRVGQVGPVGPVGQRRTTDGPV